MLSTQSARNIANVSTMIIAEPNWPRSDKEGLKRLRLNYSQAFFPLVKFGAPQFFVDRLLDP